MKLAHIQDGMKNLQQRLDSADSIKKSSLSDVESIMQGQFSKLNENIQKELKRLVESNNSTQSAATTQAVQNAVYQSTQAPHPACIEPTLITTNLTNGLKYGRSSFIRYN